MPLCNTEVEQATEDDLIELSEIQRRNLGQVYFRSNFLEKKIFPYNFALCALINMQQN